MSEEEKKQRSRENSRRYYQKNKEKVLARQKVYVKKKYASDSEYREKIKKRNRRYALNNIEKVRELKRNWATKHYKELREKGLLPPSKKEIIENQHQEIERLNNIINELEKYIDDYCWANYYEKVAGNRYIKSSILKDIREIIELKGDGSNEIVK